MGPVRVTVWNEHIHERQDERVRAIYPLGIHRAIAETITPLGIDWWLLVWPALAMAESARGELLGGTGHVVSSACPPGTRLA